MLRAMSGGALSAAWRASASERRVPMRSRRPTSWCKAPSESRRSDDVARPCQHAQTGSTGEATWALGCYVTRQRTDRVVLSACARIVRVRTKRGTTSELSTTDVTCVASRASSTLRTAGGAKA
eukprot:4884883-Prymnesium_polylepis.2